MKNSVLVKSVILGMLALPAWMFADQSSNANANASVGMNAKANAETADQAGDTSASAPKTVETHLVSEFSTLAGGTANAQALIDGLSSGSAISLTSSDASVGTVSITPTSTKLGYGEIAISLSLAQQTLTNEGISSPTLQDLQAALNGGTITKADGTTATLTGILTLRDKGMGWGAIANSEGIRLGDVERSFHSHATETASTEKSASASTEGAAEADAHVASSSTNANGNAEADEHAQAALTGKAHLPAAATDHAGSVLDATTAHGAASAAADAAASVDHPTAPEKPERPDVAQTPDHPDVPAKVDHPDVPAAVVDKPDVPAAVVDKPDVPAAVVDKPDVPAAVVDKPDVPVHPHG